MDLKIRWSETVTDLVTGKPPTPLPVLAPTFFHETAIPEVMYLEVCVGDQVTDRVAIRVQGSTGKLRMERRMDRVAPKIEKAREQAEEGE